MMHFLQEIVPLCLLLSPILCDKSILTGDAEVRYAVQNSLRLSPVQKALQNATLQHPRGLMIGAPESVQLMTNLLDSIAAKRVLDVGTFTGYSALSFAMALPEEGEVLTMDIVEQYVNIGRPFFAEADVAHKIKVHIAPALNTLDKLIEEGQSGSFDFAFIDADKDNYVNYYERCLRLLRKGGIIAVDNTIWSGAVLNDRDNSASTVAIRSFNSYVRDDPRVNISFLTLGDGLTLLFVQ